MASEGDLLIMSVDNLLSTSFTIKECELIMNQGSGLSIDGAPQRVHLIGENLIADNNSGLAVRLAWKSMHRFISFREV